MSRGTTIAWCGREYRCDAEEQLQSTGERSILGPGREEYCYGLSRAYATQHAFLLQTLALNWALAGSRRIRSG